MKNKILIIEDEMSLANILRIKFEQCNFEVFIASQGDQGIELAKDNIPDVILLDLILPQESGFDVLKKIKDIDKIKDIPVIILTNSNRDNEVDKGFELGAIDYLLKAHLNIEKVVKIVKTCIDEKKSA